MAGLRERAGAGTWEAFAPVRARALAAQLLAVAVAEALLFAAYRALGASGQWLLGLLVAVTVWALVSLVWLALKGAPAPLQLLTLLGWHLLVVVAGVAFTAIGTAGTRSTNPFPGEVLADPLAVYGWSFVALAASAVYLVVLGGWVRARRAEVAAGMVPGVGLSGTHLVRPQASPERTQLSHRRYGGSAPPHVVLLHGLAASYSIWEPVADRLGQRGIGVLVPDLLGFGGSREIGTSFSLLDHVAAVQRLLDHAGVDRPVLVGHSFGCAVAVAVAQTRPVRDLVLVAPPVFHDADQARARLSEQGWLARQAVKGQPPADILCNTMCLTRGVAAQLAPRVAPDVPETVARHAAEHTWPAYRGALLSLLEENPLPAAVTQPGAATTVIVGSADDVAPPQDVLDWPHDKVEVDAWEGGHLLPLRHPQRLADLIAAKVSAAT